MDILNWLGTASFAIAEPVAQFVLLHPERAILYLLVGSGVGYYVARQNYKQRQRRKFFEEVGRTMTTEERRDFLDRKMADELCEWQLKMWSAGKMSWQEIRAQNLRWGIKQNIRDLLPVNNHPAAIRQRVLRNSTLMFGVQKVDALLEKIKLKKPASAEPTANVVPIAPKFKQNFRRSA